MIHGLESVKVDSRTRGRESDSRTGGRVSIHGLGSVKVVSRTRVREGIHGLEAVKVGGTMVTSGCL